MKKQNQWLFEASLLPKEPKLNDLHINEYRYGISELFTEWETSTFTLQSPRFRDDARLQAAVNNSPPMRSGERGFAVQKLQQALIDLGFSMPNSTRRRTPDGIYGSETIATVREFQMAQGLQVDGFAGRQTLTKLDHLLSTSVPISPGQTPTWQPPTSSTCNPFQSKFEQAAQLVNVPISWASNSSLCNLVRGESGWNISAKNPSSSAFGLFQFLTSTWKKFLSEVPYGTTDPYWQAVGGFRYIKAAYRTPERAWGFWQSTVKKNTSLAPPDLQAKAQQWIAKGWSGY